MKISDVCKNYLNGFVEISQCQKNDSKTNTKALVKIVSYLSLVIPLTMLVILAFSTLIGRIKAKDQLNEQDQAVKKQAEKILQPIPQEPIPQEPIPQQPVPQEPIPNKQPPEVKIDVEENDAKAQLMQQSAQHSRELREILNKLPFLGYYRNSEPSFRNLITALNEYSKHGDVFKRISAVNAEGQGSSDQPETIEETFKVAINPKAHGSVTQTIAAIEEERRADNQEKLLAAKAKEVVVFLNNLLNH